MRELSSMSAWTNNKEPAKDLPSEHARDTKRHNGDQDDHVHEVIIAVQSGVTGCQDEGSHTISVSVLGVEQALIGRGHQHADEGKTKDVKECNTPEDLFDGRG